MEEGSPGLSMVVGVGSCGREFRLLTSSGKGYTSFDKREVVVFNHTSKSLSIHCVKMVSVGREC